MEFNRRILASILMIGLLCAGIGVGTMAYFKDTEKLTPGSDVLTMGILDISLDRATIVPVVGMVPCETATITFQVRNYVPERWNTIPVDVWVRIAGLTCGGGVLTEPEQAEPPNDYLAPYVIYDLYIPGVKYVVLESQEIRVDNVQNYWIYVGQIPVEGTMNVACSFHLAAWTDAPIHEITNWAQGDIMNFDIEVYATQVGAPGPDTGKLILENKDAYWKVIADGKSGEFTYDKVAKTFAFKGIGLSNIPYSLIYYADRYPGVHESAGCVLASGTPTIGILTLTGTFVQIPVEGDLNYPVGGKVWLVPSSDYTVGTGMVAWNPANYLFDMHLIKVP